VLELVGDLNRRLGRTVVLVLHELNMASRYADHLIAMKDGCIVAEGPPSDVLTASLVEEVFDVRCRIEPDPVSGTPMVIPLRRERGSRAEPVAGASADGSTPELDGRPGGAEIELLASFKVTEEHR
jgi:iron complex transport system ATP-binding protein